MRGPRVQHNLVGQNFGLLKVIGRYDKWCFICKCDCGSLTKFPAQKLLNGKALSCGCSHMANYEDLSGKTFGDMKVLCRGKDIHKKPAYQCKCLLCGGERLVEATRLKSGVVTNCGCQHRIPEPRFEFGQGYYSTVKASARNRDIEFDISLEDFLAPYYEQNGKCAFTGVDIKIKIWNEEGDASSDRKDNSVGYLKGNVQYVHKDINRMRNALTIERFVELCKKIDKFSGIFLPIDFELDIKSYLYGSVRHGAKSRNLDFQITKEDIKRKYKEQGGVCALSGEPIYFGFGRKHGKYTTVSVDRIDNTKGYTYDNIQLVHKEVNILKSTFSMEIVKSWCKKVAAHAA